MSNDLSHKSKDDALPNVATLKGSVVILDEDARQAIADQIKEANVDNERKYVHLTGLQDHYRQKRDWSKSVSRLMFFLIGFQCFLLWRVGSGAWNFEKYQWLLPALLIQNFGQVVGLAFVVVKALFSDIKE